MAIPAMARAPIAATSLLAAPVYWATAGPVVVGAVHALLGAVPVAIGADEVPAGVTLVGLAEHVLG